MHRRTFHCALGSIKEGKIWASQLRNSPCQQDPLVFFQLSHEARVGLGHCPSFLHIVIGSVQVPAILLHCIGDHSGGRATHPHFAVHEAFRSMFPCLGDSGKEENTIVSTFYLFCVWDFWCGSFFKVFIELLQYCFCLLFWFFGCEACGLLVPRPGIEPAACCRLRWSLNCWTTRKVLIVSTPEKLGS